MSMNDVTTHLLEKVRRRMALGQWAELAILNLLVLTASMTVLTIVNRLTAFAPEQMIMYVWLAIVPAAALLAAIFLKRPTLSEAAHQVDRALGEKDLFLTVSRLSSSVGEYQPVVLAVAHAKAQSVVPAKVSPWNPSRRIRPLLGLILLAGGIQFFLPQWDLFGNRAQAAVIEQRSAQLNLTRKMTEVRKTELKRAQESREMTQDQQLEENLKLAFQKMEPSRKEENRKELLKQQKEISQQWKVKAASKSSPSASRSSPSEEGQKFGDEETETLRKKAKEALRSGNMQPLKETMEQLKDELEQLAKTEDPVERAEKLEQLKKRLENLEKLAREEFGSEEMAKALERARQQAQLAQKDGGNPSEAMQAAMESMELSEMELSQAMENLKDMQNLEKALKAIQAAKKLNELDPLDGEKCKQCQSLSDYEKLYKEMLAKCNGQGDGKGNGNGLGGEGIGRGGKAQEDDSVETSFVDEKSQSQVTAGKMLLSIKTQGLGEKGQASEDYRKAATAVKQGVAEAIQQEQIPPGYHESIKSYFDQVAPEKSGSDK